MSTLTERLREWLARSPRNSLILAVVVVALAAVVGSYAFGDPAPTTSAAVSTEQDRDASTPTKPGATASAPAEPTDVTAQDKTDALAAARDYLAVFFAPDEYRNGREWLAALDPLSTTGLALLNADVPRSAVPAAQVNGVRLGGIKPTYAEVEVDLVADGEPLPVHMSLVREADGWRVDEVAPESPNGAPTAEAEGGKA